MSTTTCEPKPFQWTRETYERAGELGFFGDLRVELVEGQVVQMSPMGSRHATASGNVFDALGIAFQGTHHLRIQYPLSVSKGSQLEPDIAVIRGTRRAFRDQHPESAELVVEVSESTLNFDQNNKAKIYAAAMIPEYWIVNLIDEQIEVFRAPIADGKYAEKYIVKRGETLSPLGAPGAVLNVSDLLP